MEISFKDGILTIKAHVTEASIAAAQPSESGKNCIVDTTSGFALVAGGPHGLKCSVNVMVPNPNYMAVPKVKAAAA